MRRSAGRCPPAPRHARILQPSAGPREEAGEGQGLPRFPVGIRAETATRLSPAARTPARSPAGAPGCPRLGVSRCARCAPAPPRPQPRPPAAGPGGQVPRSPGPGASGRARSVPPAPLSDVSVCSRAGGAGTPAPALPAPPPPAGIAAAAPCTPQRSAAQLPGSRRPPLLPSPPRRAAACGLPRSRLQGLAGGRLRPLGGTLGWGGRRATAHLVRGGSRMDAASLPLATF